MEKKENAEQKKGAAVYIIIILLLLLVGGWLGLEIRDGRKQNAAFAQSVANLQTEKDYLNDILKKSGIIEESDDETLKDNLTAILMEYDSLTFDNDQMLDSINQQKAHIQGLLDEVETLQNQKKRDWGKIYKLKKETETLREIMKGYIHTIDSLNTENTGLKNTIKDKENQITDIKTDRDNIKNKNDLLNQTVALGSVLQTSSITANAIRIKSSGKQVETTRASRTSMIKSCFTVLENKIATPENKEIYMRIISPAGTELTNSEVVRFSMEGGREGIASVKRKVNYQNKNMDLCIYYEVETALEVGTYIVEIYAEGYQIGKSSFALK
ncbi:MAG: hypothetical protein P8L20_00930 [Flavobacteriales bacterium]|nr:hypothetical protein [Flavobacteriales bacterium]